MRLKQRFPRRDFSRRGKLHWMGIRHYVVKGTQIIFLVLLAGALVVYLAKHLLATQSIYQVT